MTSSPANFQEAQKHIESASQPGAQQRVSEFSAWLLVFSTEQGRSVTNLPYQSDDAGPARCSGAEFRFPRCVWRSAIIGGSEDRGGTRHCWQPRQCDGARSFGRRLPESGYFKNALAEADMAIGKVTAEPAGQAHIMRGQALANLGRDDQRRSRRSRPICKAHRTPRQGRRWNSLSPRLRRVIPLHRRRSNKLAISRFLDSAESPVTGGFRSARNDKIGLRRQFTVRGAVTLPSFPVKLSRTTKRTVY